MASVMELEFVPIEREHPLLTGTELRAIDEVLIDPEAQARGLLSEYSEDPDFRAHVAAFEKGYARLQESGVVTQERLHGLVDHLYVADAIERRAYYLNNRGLEDRDISFDIDFCTYLDLAIPIDPADRVTPDQARDGKLYWIDHILRQAEHLADRQQYGADETAEVEEQEAIQPRSERLSEMLAKAAEADKKVRRRDSVIALGGVAVLTIAESVSMPELATEAGVVAGAGALGLTGLKWVGRKLSLMTLRDGIKEAERSEALADLLPVISSDVTVSQAIRGLQYERETLKLAEKKVGESNWRDTFDEDMVVRDMLRAFDCLAYDRTGVGHLYRLTRELAHLAEGRDKYGYQFDHNRLEIMTRKLNKYLPIDQTADTITPTDEFTGEKTWQNYVEKVASGDGVSLDRLNALYLPQFLVLSPTMPLLPSWAADPTDLTFSQLEKKFGGGKSKKCKSQGWRGGSAFG